MSSLKETVEKFGAGKESYAIVQDYRAATCVEVVRILQWKDRTPASWKSEMIQCAVHPVDRAHYVRTAWKYNKEL